MSAGACDARQVAHRAVCDALTGRRYASETLGAAAADRRGMALATEIALGALRHCATIERVLSAVARYEPRRVSAALRAVLLCGGFQAVWLDQVPCFAIVDESVELAKRVAGRGAARLVNAVLRRLVGSIARRRTEWVRLNPAHVRVSWSGACEFDRPVLPAEPQANLAAAAGERPARYAALVAAFGSDEAERVAWASQAVPPVVVHRNPLRLSAADFAARVAAELGREAEVAGDAAFVKSAPVVLESELFRGGLVHIQDPTAHAAAKRVDARAGEAILDLCAAPGGKSVVMAQMMLDRGRLAAVDESEERLERVRRNVERMGLTCVAARRVDQLDADEVFDAAMVDAPCSNTGVIARRPEARLRLSAARVAGLARLQSALLHRAAAQVRPGGRLLYSTCSLERAENEEVVRAFLAGRSEWREAEDGVRLTTPSWGPRLSDWRDGGFTALLVRV